MKVSDADITSMSINEAIRFFIGTYHEKMTAIVQTNRAQLLLALENRSLRNSIKPIAEHFLILEKEILEHINQEQKILKAYLDDKKTGFEFAGVSMYAVIKEHEGILRSVEKLGLLCNQYKTQEKDHVMYKLCIAKLNNFEQDIRRNIHFENYVFFPKILKSGIVKSKI